MVIAYFIVTVIAILLWLPILLKFYRAWLGRHNPVSLAICALILLLVWSSVAGTWVVTGGVDAGVVVLVSTGMSAAVATFSHVAFYWSDKRFSGQRRKKR